jgi:hypothetical protein
MAAAKKVMRIAFMIFPVLLLKVLRANVRARPRVLLPRGRAAPFISCLS